MALQRAEDERERTRARRWLGYYVQRFVETQSLLHAWAAIREWLLAEVAVPLELHDYMDAAWRRLGAAARREEPRPPVIAPEGLAAQRESVSLPGVDPRQHESSIIVQVFESIRLHKEWSMSAHYEAVTEAHHRLCTLCDASLDAASVQRLWREHNDVFVWVLAPEMRDRRAVPRCGGR